MFQKAPREKLNFEAPYLSGMRSLAAQAVRTRDLSQVRAARERVIQPQADVATQHGYRAEGQVHPRA